jgi:hypothetical protein
MNVVNATLEVDFLGQCASESLSFAVNEAATADSSVVTAWVPG